MTLWQALREDFLEAIFGRSGLEAMRAEKKQRKECERVMRDAEHLRSKPRFLES